MNSELVKQEEKDLERVSQRAVIRPPVDIYENQEEYLVIADMPAVTKKNLEINLDGDRLTLNGGTKEEILGTQLEREFQLFDYERIFQLPQTIDRGKVSAELKNGVLTLHLPKVEEVKPRKIEIKVG